MTSNTGVFISQYLQLERLADGVYAAIAKRETGYESVNAGLVDLGKEALAFDSFTVPQAARDLLRAAKELIGKPVRWLVNSHMHSDHIQGNYVFPAETTIFSTHKTREIIVEYYPKDLAEVKAHLPEWIEEIKQERDKTSDANLKQRLSRRITVQEQVRQALDEIEMRAPEVTFGEQMIFHGARRKAELLSYREGHTPSDAVLYLPEERIIFTGDLLVVQTHPYMMSSTPEMWRATLGQIKKLDIEVAVPGHGPLGAPGDIDALLGYFDALDGMIEDAVAKGLTDKELAQLAVPAEYTSWAGGAFADNLAFLLKRRQGNG